MTEQSQAIKDQFGRPLKDLRISVIDQCNFRCTYCMPAEVFGADYPFLDKEEMLTFDEIIRTAEIFASLGVEKIRLTGGEPLLRKNLHLLIERLYSIKGIEDIALTSNGVFLPKYAKLLKEAGLNRVNLSLDAIDDDVFQSINSRGVKTSPVIKGIEAATNVGLQIKVNMVVKRGMNESQILPMARFFKGKGHILRFIEFMDVGNVNGWHNSEVVSKQEIINTITEELPLEQASPNYYGEVASRYRYKDGNGEIGVISSVTDHFCDTCTRARLSADGTLYHCLFASQGYDIRKLLRKGITDNMLKLEIMKRWSIRGDRYSANRAEGKFPSKEKIEMSYIGG
ncbi:GTP 3',8-cyclase MoaA [Pontibacillus yanchengensis]|uniref:GTP 3',8-cyclase MoaA n=2 Tax=Pontibacillus yanchengensis TaxID=462910 RepID=A0ACC7VBE1_9BACI|nr:GTP 3',8-cyclase MoaA [Pontibacillus yanchengensis]MYL52241.1 GTP 3',8-cyclase MoaA [Pontibacillus yanchengensis]